MFELPIPERILFISALIAYIAAAAAGVLQLLAAGEKYKRFLPPIVGLAVLLEVVILVFRAFALKAIPLTGLFESMIVLTVLFGLAYLFSCRAVRQVWFGSVMVWAILAMMLLAAAAAEPASKPHAAAATPWAITHGILMLIGGALTTFAAASAFLYLLAKRKLKQKKVVQVLGRVPNLEKLEHMNLFGIKAALLAIVLGLVTGFGLALAKSATLEMNIIDWLTDAKIVLIAVACLFLAVIILLRRLAALRPRITAYMTMAAFFLILFAIVGTTIFCKSKHDFAEDDVKTSQVRE